MHLLDPPQVTAASPHIVIGLIPCRKSYQDNEHEALVIWTRLKEAAAIFLRRKGLTCKFWPWEFGQWIEVHFEPSTLGFAPGADKENLHRYIPKQIRYPLHAPKAKKSDRTLKTSCTEK